MTLELHRLPLSFVFFPFFSQKVIWAPLKWDGISDVTVWPLLPEWLHHCLPYRFQSLCQLMWEDDDVSLIAWAYSPNITDKFPNGMTEHSGKWPLQFPKWWQQIASRPAKSSKSARWDKMTGQRDDGALKNIKWENPAGNVGIRWSAGWDRDREGTIYLLFLINCKGLAEFQVQMAVWQD